MDDDKAKSSNMPPCDVDAHMPHVVVGKGPPLDMGYVRVGVWALTGTSVSTRSCFFSVRPEGNAVLRLNVHGSGRAVQDVRDAFAFAEGVRVLVAGDAARTLTVESAKVMDDGVSLTVTLSSYGFGGLDDG